jgi:hypothetical protein
VRYVTLVVAIVLGGIAVVSLRDATLSTHQPVDPNSQTELIMQVRVRDPEAGQTQAEMTEALILICRLEINSDLVGPIQDLGDGRVRAVLQPSMDKSNRRQFRGCLEDWNIDQLRADVTRLAAISTP